MRELPCRSIGGRIAAVTLVVAGGVAAAGGGTWVPAGFGGAGAFLGVFFDRAHPGVIYALSDVSGVHRSTDWGNHWEVRSVGLGNLEISSFAVDPFDSNTLYAGAGALAEASTAGIYVSHDAGLTWSHLPATAARGVTFRRMRTADAIACDPSARGVIISGSRGSGVWRSTDSGASWTQVLAAPQTSVDIFEPGMAPDDPTSTPYPAPVSTVAFDPASPTTVWAAFDGAGVYRSTAGGIAGSWQPASTGLPGAAPVRDLGVSSSGVLWAAVRNAGVYRSANGGTSWVAANGGLPLAAGPVSSVAAHPTNPLVAWATVVAYAINTVWKTSNGGATWAELTEITYDPAHNPTRAYALWPTLTWHVDVSPTHPDRLFYVDFWAIMRSDDGGTHSSDVITGAQNTCVTSIIVDTDHGAGQPDTVYHSVWDAGLLASIDRGVSWRMVTPSTPEAWEENIVGHYWDLAIARSGTTKVFLTSATAGEPEQVLIRRSTDGLTWSTVLTLPRPEPGFVGAVTLAVDPAHPATVYAAVDGGSVYRSTNAGLTWTPTVRQPASNRFTYGLEVDSAGRVYLATFDSGVFRSSNGGSTWDNVFDTIGTVFRLAVSGTSVWAVGNGADQPDAWRSSDGGATWQPLATPAQVDDNDGVASHGTTLAVDPVNPAHLLFGTVDTWHPSDAGAGVFESSDGGATWVDASAGLGLRSVGVLALTADGTAWAGTSCGSVWRRDKVSCTLGCTATVPSTATLGVAVTFAATATATGCSGTPAYAWAFGDGATASQASATHAYTAAGSYPWTLVVTAGTASCTKTGTVTVAPCQVSCTATVPATATAGVAVALTGSATLSGCGTGTSPVYDWDFGDGSSHSPQPSPSHTWAAVGSYTWSVTVTALGVRCTKSGTITVAEPPPAATYIVPAVAHSSGVGSTQWRTDLAAVNRSAGAATLTLTYSSDAAPVVRTATLAAGATVEWRDILVSLFGLAAGANASGTVHVASSAVLGVASRTYNLTATGTFGQSYPALTVAEALMPGRVGLLPQLKKSSEFRTNLGIVNLGSASCTALVRLFGVSGAQVGSSKAMTAAGGRFAQQTDIFANVGAGEQALGYATVEVQTPGCTLWAYASVIDQATGDPTTVPVLVP